MDCLSLDCPLGRPLEALESRLSETTDALSLAASAAGTSRFATITGRYNSRGDEARERSEGEFKSLITDRVTVRAADSVALRGAPTDSRELVVLVLLRSMITIALAVITSRWRTRRRGWQEATLVRTCLMP